MSTIDCQRNAEQNYILNLNNVEEVSITNCQITNISNFGFINMKGNIANSIQTSVFKIKNNIFEGIKNIAKPFIKVNIVKIFTSDILKVTNIYYSEYNNFLDIQLTELVDINDFYITNSTNLTEISIKNKRILENSNIEQSYESFILQFEGVNKTKLKNIQFINCNQTGILNLNTLTTNQTITYSGKSLETQNLLVNNSNNINQEPLFRLYNQYIKLEKFKISNITQQGHIIEANQFIEFNVSESYFQNIRLQDSTVLSAQNSQKNNGSLVLSNVNFDDIIAQNYSSCLVVRELNSLQIKNSSFLNLQNNNSLLEIQRGNEFQNGVINIQQCRNLKIFHSNFKKNKQYQNGGSIYISNIINITVFNTIFLNNEALEKSGGAIYMLNSKMSIIESTFKSNKAKQEKGGAIYSSQSNLNLVKTNISENEAIIGGGIYHDSNELLKFSSSNNIFNNTGHFYGDNIGSQPKYIKRIDQDSKNIDIFDFQSGNYTKEEIYVQLLDEESKYLNFTFNKEKKFNVSKAIIDEIDLIKIELNFEKESDMQITFGKQLQLDSNSKDNIKQNSFKLNITAQYKQKQEFKGFLTANYKDVYLSVKLKFRNCIPGEIKNQKNGYIECYECQIHSYSIEDPNNGDIISCKKCPTEAIDCYANKIILNDDNWRSSNLTDDIYPCHTNGCSEKRNNSKAGCIEGYIGPVCASCDYRGQVWNNIYGLQGQDCLKCQQLQFVYLYVAATIIFYIIYINHNIDSQVSQKSLMIKLDYLRKMDILFISRTKYIVADSSVLTKIFLNYIQIFSISLNFLSQIPFGLKNTLNVVGDPSSSTYSSYDCMFSSSFISQLWLNRFIVLCCQNFLISIVILFIRKYLFKENNKKLKIKIYAIFLYFFYYPSITKLLISLSLCKEFGQKSYMLGDYLEECWTNDHILISIFFLYPLTILWAIGIPLLLLKKMKTAQNKNQSQTLDYIFSYYLIQQGYKEKFYYWEIVKMFYKFFIIICLNILSSKLEQSIFICLICGVYLQLLQKLKPYNTKQLMEIEHLLSQIMFYSLILQLIIDVSSQWSFLHISALLMISMANFYGFILFLKQFLINLSRKNGSKFKSRFLRIFKNITKQSDISLIRTSFLWKRMRKVVDQNKQNLKTYYKNIMFVSQLKQKEIPPLTINENILQNSDQDLFIGTSQVNTPIVSAIASATQEKLFRFNPFVKDK